MKLFLLFLFLIVLIGCGSDEVTNPVDKKCSPVCESWEICNDGTCVLNAGYCNADSNCTDTSKSKCDLTTHICIAEQTSCTPACQSWQTCNETTSQCEAKPGYCDSTTLCTSPSKPICDETNHICVPESTNCSPECDGSWQYCYNGTCKTRPGFCGEDRLCENEALPVCDETIHLCIQEEQTCVPGCQIWQYCEDAACYTKPGQCAGDQDCLDLDYPKCDLDMHVCVSMTGYCNTDNDCDDPNYPVCDVAHHSCIFGVTYTEPTTIENYVAVIVTTNALKPSFEKLAFLHTMLGTYTKVVTKEEICANTTCNTNSKTDASKAIKDYLKIQTNLKYALIGGDFEDIPSRQVHDTFSNSLYGVSYDETFYTDNYFADFSEWDNNNDGTYAGTGDSPDYLPEIGVSRLPVSNETEFNDYYTKIISYLTNYDISQIKEALLLSNVATKFSVAGYTSVPVDSAQYLEMEGRTADIMAGFNFTKLYATKSSDWGSFKLNLQKEESALETGGNWGGEFLKGNPNIVVHLGHGGVDLLTCEADNNDNDFTGDMAYDLSSDIYSIFLSCACEAGTFSADDSAGEKLINNPDGGAVVYLGDAAVGLGVAGGSQLIDEFLKYVFQTATSTPLIGDAIKAAHRNLPRTDSLRFPVLGNIPFSPIDTDSWEWTQKVATLLGDLLLPVWYKEIDVTPTIVISKRSIPDNTGTEVIFRLSVAVPRATIMFKTNNGNVYKADTLQTAETSVYINEEISSIDYSFTSEYTTYAFGKKTF